MAGKRRSGLANDRRAYGASKQCPIIPRTYAVTYNSNGNTSGSVPIDGSSPYTFGLTVTVLGNSGALVKNGFTFVGWNRAANGSGTSYSQGDTFAIRSNTVLYAQWIVTTYTVTYNGNVETSGSAPTDGSSPYVTGSTVTVLGNSGALVKNGFIFVGWNRAANGSGTSYSQGDSFVISDNTTLYARWTPTYTVTYNGNVETSGSAPTDGSSPYVTGSTVTVLGNTDSLIKSGFIFAGWNTAANGSGTSYSQGDSFTINANTILYARWTPTYTVTYNGNVETSGSAPTDGSSPYTTGSTVTVLGNSGSLVKSGFIFAGWNTAANGSGTSYSQGNTFAINANTILYARWTPLYTVTYNGNDETTGSAPTDGSSPYISGTTVTVLGNSGSLVKTGSTFAGWNTAANGSGTSYSQGNTFAINANVILYARWTAIVPPPSAPTALSAVAGNTQAYILFTQTGTVTNYEYSTDNGVTFLAFNPPQIYSPVNIQTLSSNGVTPLTNGTTYTVILKAVNSVGSSVESDPVSVVPAVTTLLSAGRLINLDANNTSSYPGSGTTWTNLDSGGAYSATLQNTPIFDNTNKWFTFNGINQIAQIAAAAAINPTTPFSPFTIQIWARVNTASPNFGAFDGLISKQFGSSSGYDGYSLNLASSTSVALKMNGQNVNATEYSSAGVYNNGWALYTIVVSFGGGSGSPSYTYVSTRRVVTYADSETVMPNPAAPLQFPRGVQDTGVYFCPADVGAFYLYNTALSQETIIQNFDATKPRYNV